MWTLSRYAEASVAPNPFSRELPSNIFSVGFAPSFPASFVFGNSDGKYDDRSALWEMSRIVFEKSNSIAAAL